MSSSVRQARPDPSVMPAPDATQEVWDEWSASLPHACETADRPTGPVESKAGRQRLVGIDAARGLALLGMFAVHVMSAETSDGSVSIAWRISSGNSSAMFALLAGVGLAFMSGRTRIPSVTQWLHHSRRLVVRGIAILVLGLLLGLVVPVGLAGVILPYLGLLFVLVLPFLRSRSTTLFVVAALWAVGGPVLSHLLRAGAAEPPAVNLTVGDLAADPFGSLDYLLVSGLYPILTWFPYLLVGLALGRLDLTSRRYALSISVAGAALWLGSVTTSWAVLGRGGLERLAADESGRMGLGELTALLLWGGDGTAPATSWWWFASAAPHTGLPLDLARTTGMALLVLGLCLGVADVASWLVQPLALPGSMTLTLYTVHLLLLVLLPVGALPEAAVLGVHVAVLFAFAYLWHRRFRRGPLEAAVWWLASRAGTARGAGAAPGAGATRGAGAAGRV